MSVRPQLPKGTRDFLPAEIKKRTYIFDIIKEQFRVFGYEALETPAMESLETLMGNYGEEGDRLLFKVLNNGDFLADVPVEYLHERNSNRVVPSISKRGLRYDLTVPFARFLVMNRQHIKFPFKRSAIQPVWRADRPQRGRYQEFYQCDADVAGSDSLMYEAELLQLYDAVFVKLNLPVDIYWNNRKILYGIVEDAGLANDFSTITIWLDKADKIGEVGVRDALLSKGFDSDAIDLVMRLTGTRNLSDLETQMLSATGKKGIREIRDVMSFMNAEEMKCSLIFDPSLARGLGYYTGCIFEVKARDATMGSIGGGGRYDNLTEVFGLKDTSGVGISFGVERIYDLMEEKNLFPEQLQSTKNLIFLPLEDKGHRLAVAYAQKLRQRGIACEVYPDTAKLQKQLAYAGDLGYLFAGMIGENEVNSGNVTLKNLETGEQIHVTFNELAEKIKK